MTVLPSTPFLGWDAVELANPSLRTVVVPDVGGRLLQLWLGDHPFLFVNRRLHGKLFSPEENQGDGTIASWKNYGGNKTWPAPQGWDGPHQWAGPPDPVLDSGRFTVTASEPGRVVVQSPPDPRSGLQITRQVTLDPLAARLSLAREMRNVSHRPVRWSLWDVTQLACGQIDAAGRDDVRPGCRIYLPVSVSGEGYSVLYGPEDSPQFRLAEPGLLVVDYAAALGKIGADDRAGWVAFADADGDGDGDWVLAHQFAYHEGLEYPDGGVSVEVWTHGPGVASGVDFSAPHLRDFFMEMEVLGPLVSLAPGASARETITWGACRCPGPIRAVTAAGCVSQPLTVDQSRAQGVFGVFAPGQARLRDEAGTLLASLAATPLAPLRLDVPVPPDPRRLELVSVDATGADRGIVASWTA